MTRSRGLGDETGTGSARPGGPAAEVHPLPAPGFADVRIVAASAEAARTIAHLLRSRFAGTEQGGGTTDDGGTYLHLTVDTVHFPETAGPVRLRLVSGGRDRDGVHAVTADTRDADADADTDGHQGQDGTGGAGATRGATADGAGTAAADSAAATTDDDAPTRPPARPPTPDDRSGDRFST